MRFEFEDTYFTDGFMKFWFEAKSPVAEGLVNAWSCD